MSLRTVHGFRLYVAEVNTVTGKMTMYPAEVFNMHPVTEGQCCQVSSLLIYSLAHSLVNSVIQSFIHSLSHSFTHLAIHSLTYLCILLLTHSFAHSFIHSFIYHSLIHSPTHSFIYLPSHTHSLACFLTGMFCIQKPKCC